MPKVGKKHYSYSPKGRAAAKRDAKKRGLKVKSAYGGGPIKGPKIRGRKNPGGKQPPHPDPDGERIRPYGSRRPHPDPDGERITPYGNRPPSGKTSVGSSRRPKQPSGRKKSGGMGVQRYMHGGSVKSCAVNLGAGAPKRPR